jgi:hypothetical protein
VKYIFSFSGVSARVRRRDPRARRASRRAGRAEGATKEHDAKFGAARIANADIVPALSGLRRSFASDKTSRGVSMNRHARLDATGFTELLLAGGARAKFSACQQSDEI